MPYRDPEGSVATTPCCPGSLGGRVVHPLRTVARAPPTLSPVRDLFVLDPGLVFLNHGSFGACPGAVLDEYQRIQREIERNPVAALSLYRGFPDAIARVRERLAAYVGADAADLVLVPNATTGVNLVARSLDLRPGDEVVSTTHEYGGNDLLWQWVCERRGARYIRVDTTPARRSEEHTSELQSHSDLVCRLLLEKKKRLT